MTRVKRGVAANKRRKNVLAKTVGFRWRRKTNFVAAKEALIKAGKYARRDRRNKKRTFRGLWIIRLGNALRELGFSYRGFIATTKAKSVELDRKVLSELAVQQPVAFKQLAEKINQ
ncbi:MAG: 50S ribosomal protein L20 [Candidatus Moranbacteria bacterium]|jgi:large subunit ribosomal protein L20|nr:50S ribosomal protein L20 [Candidatus Moranbacteria bacterium]